MFNLNRVICDYPLPVSGFAEEMKSPPDWSEVEFQLDEDCQIDKNFFSKYSIESDGQIYEERVDFKVNENAAIEQISLGIEKKEYTGELIFHGIHLEEKYDFLMSFKSLFWKGDLKEIELIDWEKNKNAERVKFQTNQLEKIEKEVAKREKWWYGPWSLISRILRVFLVGLMRLLGFFLRTVSSIENRLAS